METGQYACIQKTIHLVFLKLYIFQKILFKN